jgi:hypothetical protein
VINNYINNLNGFNNNISKMIEKLNDLDRENILLCEKLIILKNEEINARNTNDKTLENSTKMEITDENNYQSDIDSKNSVLDTPKYTTVNQFYCDDLIQFDENNIVEERMNSNATFEERPNSISTNTNSNRYYSNNNQKADYYTQPFNTEDNTDKFSDRISEKLSIDDDPKSKLNQSINKIQRIKYKTCSFEKKSGSSKSKSKANKIKSKENINVFDFDLNEKK